MKKNALIIFDEEEVKIVFGTMMKCFKIDDLKKNSGFIDRLFSETTVFVLEKVSKIDKETFLAGIQSKNEPEPQEDEFFKQDEEDLNQEEEPNQAVKKPRSVVAELPRKKPPQKDYGFFVKSTAKSSIIIDDLLTADEIPDAPGVRKAVAIPYGLAVDLSMMPTEELNKSKILKRLLENGTLIRVHSSEAARLQQEYEKKRKDNDAAGSIILDRPVSQLINGGMNEDVIEVEADPEEEEVSTVRRSNKASSVNLTDLLDTTAYTLEEIANMRNSSDVDDVEEEPEQRKLPTRTRNPFAGVEPKGMRRLNKD